MKSGQRLMLLLKTRLPEILSKESANQSSIYLYNIGDYWVAFEKSAYKLTQLYMNSNTSVMQLQKLPFPIIMTSISDKVLANSKLEKTDMVIKPTIKSFHDNYTLWHREKEQALLR